MAVPVQRSKSALSDFLPGGYDISFDLPVLQDGQRAGVTCNARQLCVFDERNPSEDIYTFVGFKRSGTDLYAVAYIVPDADDLIEEIKVGSATVAYSVRLVWSNDFCSVYLNEVWKYSFGFRPVSWGEPRKIYLEVLDGTSSVNFTNVVSQELYSGREAIFVEMENTGFGGLSAVVQERPVEVWPIYDGKIAFTYALERDAVTLAGARIRNDDEIEQEVSQAGSDIIAYFSNVRVIRNIDYETDIGFATRVYRLSNLDDDAMLAAHILNEKLFNSQHMRKITLRPDLRVELGDVLHFTYTSSSTQTEVDVYMVAESILVGVSSSGEKLTSTMTITGREVESGA